MLSSKDRQNDFEVNHFSRRLKTFKALISVVNPDSTSVPTDNYAISCVKTNNVMCELG